LRYRHFTPQILRDLVLSAGGLDIIDLESYGDMEAERSFYRWSRYAGSKIAIFASSHSGSSSTVGFTKLLFGNDNSRKKNALALHSHGLRDLRPQLGELPNAARLGDGRCATGTTLAGYRAPTT
jgi:hypothetical protein